MDTLIKLQNFYSSKGNIKETKRQNQRSKSISNTYSLEKIYIQILCIKNSYSHLLKRVKYVNRNFTKEDIRQLVHEKMFGIFNHQGNGN